ncbi:MAG TPA: DUF4832 domain-containing protein, partial [Bacteroidetes bacterium]|nr:DUF4832 domain-containing protein [Bacteroidota bacterium]
LYHQISNVSSESLNEFKQEGIRLILINYVLSDFRTTPLSADFLRTFDSDLQKIRQAGLKIIVRFAYTIQLSNPYGDAAPQIILTHIQQLKHILQSNSDVILTLQAGFIGTWGEWYYTDYFSVSPGVISEQNWADRRSVVDALLDALPNDRMIQLRTPTFKKEMLQESSFIPITDTEAYSGSKRARLAHHNDCFVAGSADFGTYHNISIEKPYLENDSKYTIVGGETCNRSSESHCPNSLSELQRFHWTFLNVDYHQGVLNDWRSEGCFDEIQKKLGYRYTLSNAHLQTTAKPNGEINFSINIINTGWANPTNKYDLQLILRNTTDQSEYKYTLKEDLRKWPINQNHHINLTVGLPEDIVLGDYEMFIAIKDNRLSLAFNPDYSIQLANENLWESTKGYNDLNNIITISNNNALPNYTGTDYFKLDGIPTLGFKGPKAIKITQYNNNNIIYWSKNDNVENQIVRLQKSKDNVNFVTIADKNNNDISYIDRNLENNTTYYYRVQNILNNNFSELTNTQTTKVNSPQKEFLFVQIDGQDKDWDLVPPVLTGYQNGMVALKLANYNNELTFYIEALNINTYQLYFNLNNDENYRLSSDSLFKKNNTVWEFVKKIELTKATGFLEGRISMSDTNFAQRAQLYGQLLLNGENIWGENQSFYFLKYQSLAIPERFKIAPSVVSPKSKVKISWRLDSTVEGYIIERSDGDSEHFEVIADISKNNNYFIDKNLDSTITYHYRMFKYNDIIRSNYTESENINLALGTKTNELDQISQSIKIFPNPMREHSTIKIDIEDHIDAQINLYDTNMKLVKNIFNGKLNSQQQIAMTKNGLANGIYFIHIQTKYFSIVKKLIIN